MVPPAGLTASATSGCSAAMDSMCRVIMAIDLWEFKPSTRQWTWVGGSPFCSYSFAGFTAMYGTVGVPAIGNVPWSLVYATAWSDTTGNLWMFGGLGYDENSVGYYLNDTWEFFPSSGEWAFVSQNSEGAGGSALGIYGTIGDWSPAEIPGERYSAVGWTDRDGNFWMFGGYGLNVSNTTVTLSNLWEFKPSLNEWSWMGGSDTPPCQLGGGSSNCVKGGLPGTYGTLGTPSPINAPGARTSAATWTDSSGNLWMFGGTGYDQQGVHGVLNDIWQYSLKGSLSGAAPLPAAAEPVLSLAVGGYTSAQTLSISDSTPGTTIYYTTDGTNPTSTSTVYSKPLTVSSSETVEAIAVASNYSASPVAIGAYVIGLPQAATPTFSVPAGTYDSSQTVTISDATTGATIYYTTDGSNPTSSSTVYNGVITVSATETLDAIAVATGYANSAVASAAYTITPSPTFTLQASPPSLTVSPGSQGTVTLTVTPEYGFNSTVSFTCSGLPSGATCAFGPANISPLGAAATSVLTISTSLQTANWRPDSRASIGLAALGLTAFLFGWRRRRLHPPKSLR